MFRSFSFEQTKSEKIINNKLVICFEFADNQLFDYVKFSFN